MASRRGHFRVAIYSHDTYGLGHLTRSTRIARGVLQGLPGSSVLILSGSPIAHRFAFPAGVDYIKLPAVVKTGPETYVARELKISRGAIRGMRSRLILDALGYFRPDLLLVDNVPLGMKGELQPALQWVRGHLPGTQIHLNLRDILDASSAIRETWHKLGVHRILDRYFDAIHVFGCPTVLDSVSAYGLPAARSAYLGYIRPFRDELQNGPPLPPAFPGRRRILVTIGGGGDGNDILRCVTDLQRSLGRSSPFQFHIVTGPLIDREAHRALSRSVRRLAGITLHEYVEGLPAWMARCDLVVSMGGYNTLCEVMTVAQRSLVIPRIHPRREQELRARAFESRGLLKVLHPKDLCVSSLDRALREVLADAEGTPAIRRLPMTGIHRLQHRLRELLAAPPAARSNSGASDRETQRTPSSTNGIVLHK